MSRKTKRGGKITDYTIDQNLKNGTCSMLEAVSNENNESLQQNVSNISDFELGSKTSSPNLKKIKLESVVHTPTEMNVENIKEEKTYPAINIPIIPGLKHAIKEEKTYPAINIPIIPGLKDAAEKECWIECEKLIKKNIGLKTAELKQIQFAKEYKNMLEKAVSKGFIDLIKLFLHNEFPVNKVIHNSCLLIYSLKYNKMDIFNLLLEAGAEVNCKRPCHSTPLHICAEKGNLKTMQLLISKGADITAVDWDGNGVLHVAAQNNYYEIVEFLIDQGVELNVKGCAGNTALCISTEKGYNDIIKLLLDKGADPNLGGWRKSTPLHICTEKGHYEIVKLLVDKGANFDLKDYEGNTPLHISVLKGHDNIFTLLHEKGANINARNNKKETPLIIAAKEGNTTIVEQLLKDVFCDTDAKTVQGWYEKTARDWAIEKKHSSIVSLLPQPTPEQAYYSDY